MMFLTNLLISCMFALAPVNNVQPVQDQQYNEVLERKNLVGVPNSSCSMWSSDIVGNEFLITMISAFGEYNSQYANIGPNNDNNLEIVIGDSEKPIGRLTHIDSTTGNIVDDSNKILSIHYIRFNKTYAGYLDGDNGRTYKFYYAFNLMGLDNTQYISVGFTLLTWRSIYFPPFIQFDGLFGYNLNSSVTGITNSNILYQEDSSWEGYSTLLPMSNIYLPYYYDHYVYQEADYTNGYNAGFDVGYQNGKEYGQNNPNQSTRDAIYQEGKQVGDAEGYQRALDQNSTAATIFSGLVTVGLLPVNVMLSMFEYEVFGINIAGLVSGLFTIAIVIIIIRLVTGKKND